MRVSPTTEIQMEIRIAQVKTVPQKGALKENHRILVELLENISSESIDVIITPECFLDGYVCTEEYMTATGHFPIVSL